MRLRLAELAGRQEPNDEAKLLFAEYRFNRPGRPPDLDPVAHLDRLGLGEMPGRDRRAAGAEFIAVTSLLVQCGNLTPAGGLAHRPSVGQSQELRRSPLVGGGARVGGG